VRLCSLIVVSSYYVSSQLFEIPYPDRPKQKKRKTMIV
jgi:hypothetical protein